MRNSLTAGAVVAAMMAAGPAEAEVPVTSFSLENGMRVVVIEDHRAPVVTHMVWYPVGAADEPPGQSGVAHFFEHLMFKGTDDLEPGEFSRTVAANGGRENAFTAQDYTGYFQRVAADRLGMMMSLEAERMQDLILNDEVVDTERQVILEERNSRTDNSPQALFMERMKAMQFLNHPYGIPIIGWRHEIEQLSTEDAIDFYERYYAPDNAILVVAGDVTPDAVRALAEEHYGPLEPSGNPPGPRPQEPPRLEERRMVMEDAQVRQPYMMRLYNVPSLTPGDPAEAAALRLMSSILGSGITSMLSQTVQIGEGKAIDVGSWYRSNSRDPDTLALYAVPAPGVTLEEVEASVDAVIETLRTDGPDAEHLERIRSEILANEIYALDDQAGLARRYGSALAAGFTVEDVQAWPGAIAAVTAEDVKAAAETWLRPERAVTGYLTAPEDPETATENGEAG